MRPLLPFAISSLIANLVSTPVIGADMNIKIEIPQIPVAEYHRPYVSMWIERADQSFAGNLSVWYDVKKRDNEGAKWLKDMRQWWRRSGRELQLPVDGLTGATKIVGEHTVNFTDKNKTIENLSAGSYQLVVEAAREGGGREVLKVPFQWPLKTLQTITSQGSHELGLLTLTIKP